MNRARMGDQVRVHYTGRLDSGQVFDASTGGDPLEFRVGDGELLSGFERCVVGMEPGQSRTITLDPTQAYGLHRGELVVDVDRGSFPEHLVPEKGMELNFPRQDGSTLLVTVLEVGEESVRVDANHPLAGQTLTFDVQLLEIL